MAGSLSGIASQILQATTSPGGQSILPRFMIRPLAVLATTDSSGRQGKGVSDALVREAIVLFDASRKRGQTSDRTVPGWRVSSDVAQAVQVLPPPIDELQLRTLARVGRRVQELTLNHPRLTPILEAAVREGYPYLVAQLGQGFEQLSRRAGLPMEPRQAFQITDQVMDALKYAHYVGFVHGALSLDDVLVNDRGVVSVLGVGLAQLRSLVDAETQIKSSPLLAPEAVSNQPVGTPADVYATGALLFVLLTGQAPKAGQTVRISHSVPDVPPSVDAVLTRALAVDPADRYPDILSLSHALRMAMHSARRHRTPAPAQPAGDRSTRPGTRDSKRITGFPEPLPMPVPDVSVFTEVLQMPTFESLPVVEMPVIPQIPVIDWNALLQPVDVSKYSNSRIELPDFTDLDFVDPLYAAAKAARDAERFAAARAAIPMAPSPASRAPRGQRRAKPQRRSR